VESLPSTQAETSMTEYERRRRALEAYLGTNPPMAEYEKRKKALEDYLGK
jgi:tRNA A37 N6-isopentenylltransferase MiaA